MSILRSPPFESSRRSLPRPTLLMVAEMWTAEEPAERFDMRPVNEERVIVEYARVHRLVEPSLGLDALAPFAEDLLMRLEGGVDLTGRWWKREWRLGNIEPRKEANGSVIQLSGQFGWYEETATVDAPPPYDETSHSWTDEPATAPEGTLALFVIDARTQIMAITSLAGDVSVPGLCHALTDLLNQSEIQASQTSGGVRARREWLVERIDEGGTFETWVSSMDRVVRVSARFHRPNPRSRDEIQPAVDYLNELGALNGAVAATGDELDPYGHPIMRAAIAMQENDYGSVTAQGVRPDGEVDAFASREHPTRDVITPDPEDPSLSMAGIVALMLRSLATRIERGMR